MDRYFHNIDGLCRRSEFSWRWERSTRPVTSLITFPVEQKSTPEHNTLQLSRYRATLVRRIGRNTGSITSQWCEALEFERISVVSKLRCIDLEHPDQRPEISGFSTPSNTPACFQRIIIVIRRSGAMGTRALFCASTNLDLVTLFDVVSLVVSSELDYIISILVHRTCSTFELQIKIAPQSRTQYIKLS